MFNRQNPDRAPNSHFVAAHAQVLWEHEIRYSLGNQPEPMPEPFMLWLPGDEEPSPQPPSRPRIGPAEHRTLCASTAEPWLAGLLQQVVPVVERTSTDEGLLNWLVTRDSFSTWPSSHDLRYAVLLARHLGLPYESLLERAAVREKEHEARWLTEYGQAKTHHDRSKKYPQDWSHLRFVRYVNATPVD